MAFLEKPPKLAATAASRKWVMYPSLRHRRSDGWPLYGLVVQSRGQNLGALCGAMRANQEKSKSFGGQVL